MINNTLSYMMFRLKPQTACNSDPGYGELPEGLPTDMNTFLVEHGITGDRLHDITKEINGDYEGFLKKAKLADETWGIPKAEWFKLATNSKIDLMGSDAKRVSSDLKSSFKSGNLDEKFQSALLTLSELALEHSLDFQPESEDEEVWKEISESMTDLADKIGGLR